MRAFLVLLLLAGPAFAADFDGSSYSVPAFTAGASGEGLGSTYYGRQYRMRAKRISTGATTFWNVRGAPDTTGASSLYPGDVNTIVIVLVF